ncbi:thiamin monophosphate kinase [Syntrophotalea carbinolica DSM 2380]|uniref:Thiamine-monophosphate kinase n=1 Tax=Syntrophotalea carbinolica (strain DSM 2380 / NBRC 103641 / GraBd1) TaxID=338963 RepID=Q3A8K1_SYNC1|nr:thiamine-phosphate kinase [Syntrophotalea carbinolica]ABA87291.1 thiamin monophosphate kinase [Syntrophotalea carbinolica DSM 2380]
MKLAELGEFGFIKRIRAAAASGEGVCHSIGDDCAVLELPPGQRLLTTKDLLIEGVHFQRAWTDSRSLGRKSVSVNVSDIAAMGGRPRHLYLGLGVPADFSVEELQLFMDGFLEAVTAYGACLVGGDTCRSPGPLLISVTAEGSVAAGREVRRAGAGIGQIIYVSGTLGDSALALQQLGKGEVPDSFLASRHHDPTARVALGQALAQAGLATAMIDISDGVLADLGHILKASSVGALLEESLLPLSGAFRAVLQHAPHLLQLALSGGEDYELLFTVAPEREAEVDALARTLALPLTRIGVITSADEGLRLRAADGSLRPAEGKGFNHFAQ